MDPDDDDVEADDRRPAIGSKTALRGSVFSGVFDDDVEDADFDDDGGERTAAAPVSDGGDSNPTARFVPSCAPFLLGSE